MRRWGQIADPKNDVGIDRGHARQETVPIADMVHDDGAELRQSFLEDGGAHCVFFDDQYL